MSDLNNSLDRFQAFQKLPVEIRLIIWDLSIDKRRIVQIQRHVSSEVDTQDHTKGWKIVSACTPLALWVNHESRTYALKSYRLLFPPGTNSNLYINDLDSLYLFTPPFEDNDEHDIYRMWLADGEMELACVYLCKYGMMTSIMMDYKHLCYGSEDFDISADHEDNTMLADAWAESLYILADLISLTFLRNGDTELLHGQRQISQPTPIPTVLDRLLRQFRSQLYKVDGLEEEEVPFPSITICGSSREIQE
ncbi:hypothetical protein ACEPPN_015176 [Leptodophora sp. 'Broadleaf-Isolate-01']